MMRSVGLALTALLVVLVPGLAEVTVSPPDWKPAGVQPLNLPLVKTFTVHNTSDQTVTIVSYAGAQRAQIQLERMVLPPHSETPLTVTLPLSGIDQSSTTLKGEVVLLLDTDQDTVKIPFAIELAGAEETPPALPQRPKYRPRPVDQPVTVSFYYDGSCGVCENFLRTVITPCQEHFADAPVTFVLGNFREPDKLAELEALKVRYGVTDDSTTYLFCGAQAWSAKPEIEAGIYPLLEAELRHPTALPERFGPVPPSPEESAAAGQQLLEQKFAKFTAPAIVIGGLIDGINPCAIAMAVFLIVMLTRLGHDRRAVLAAGGAFAAAVWVTYFLIGLAVIQSLSLFGSRELPGRLLNGVVGLAALVFGGLQVRDVLRLRAGGGTREVTLQLPLKLKQLAHRFVREGLARPAVILGAIGAGVLVTLLEAVCTGQMYVPVLTAMVGTPELKPRAVQLLVLYNFGFIAPLLLILGLTWQGVSSASLADLARRHLVTAKLALAALLGGLGLYLLITALR